MSVLQYNEGNGGIYRQKHLVPSQSTQEWIYHTFPFLITNRTDLRPKRLDSPDTMQDSVQIVVERFEAEGGLGTSGASQASQASLRHQAEVGSAGCEVRDLTRLCHCD